MNGELTRFRQDLVSNDTLRGEVMALGADLAAVVAYANANGYAFTLEDVEAADDERELTDADLQAVAGGTKRRPPRRY